MGCGHKYGPAAGRGPSEQLWPPLTSHAKAAGIEGGTLGGGDTDFQAELLQGPAVGLGHVLPGGRDVGLGHKEAAQAHVDVLGRSGPGEKYAAPLLSVRSVPVLAAPSCRDSHHPPAGLIPHLQLLGAARRRGQGDVLQLFDPVTEVGHPLDDGHACGYCVV